MSSRSKAGVGADPTFGAKHDARSDKSVRANPATGADFCPGLDKNERPDFRRGVDAGPFCNERGQMNARVNRRRWMKQCGDSRPSSIRLGCNDWHRPCRHPLKHVWMYNYRPGQCLLQSRRVTSVVQETHFVRCRYLQRCDAGQLQIDIRRGSTCCLRDRGEGVRSVSFEEARISDHFREVSKFGPSAVLHIWGCGLPTCCQALDSWLRSPAEPSSIAPCSRCPGRCAPARSAGAAARPPGPRLRAALCRGQVGTRGWRLQSNQEMPVA
jgi:hypothetical protein